MNIEEKWEQGEALAIQHFPNNQVKQREFAVCFVYLTTGMFGGAPTIREHMVSHAVALQGSGEYRQDTALGQLFFVDSQVKVCGDFTDDEAVQFILPWLKADLSVDSPQRQFAFQVLHREDGRIWDNDPIDMQALGLT